MPRTRIHQLTAYPELRTGASEVTPEILKRSAFGKPPQQDQYRSRYGRSLTLDRIESALRGAQNGYMRDLTDMARETVGIDPHLASVLSKRINAVASLPHEIRPAEGPGVDTKLAQAYSEFVREQILMIPHFKQSLKQLAWGLFDARAALEIQWVNRDHISSTGTRGTWRAAELTWIHPRRLQFGPERELRISDEAVSYAFAPLGLALRDWRCKFIEFRPQLFGDYPELEGLAPRCLYWSFFKRFSARERMVLVELFGKPWRIVKVDEESQASDQDLLDAGAIADQLGGVTTARMPRGVNLEVVKTDPASGEIHADVIAESDKQISKLVLGQTGTTDAQPGALGGGMQSMVMKDEQLLIAQGDAELISESIEDGLTDAIIELNFGTQALLHAPRFVLKAESIPDRKADTDRMKMALELGLSVAVDEAYDIIGFRKPDAAEAVIRMIDMPNGMGGNARVAVISVTPKELSDADQAFEDANTATGIPGPALPPTTDPSAKPRIDIELAVSDIGTIFTVNEGRDSQGAGPLKLPDGTDDPDGFLTIAEFKAKRQAKGALVGEGEGTLASPVPPAPAPAPALPGAAPSEAGAPPVDLAEAQKNAIADALGIAKADEEMQAASDALLSNLYLEMQGSPHGCHHASDCARSVALAKNRQPDTVHGTLETLIDKGVREAARVTSKWAETFAAAVRGESNAARIQRNLQRAAERLDVLPFARTIERRLVHSAMTGALDSQWEDESGELIAPEEFSTPESAKAARVKLAPVKDVSPDFTSMAYQEALKYFKGKKPISKSIFEKLNSAAKARSFTVAGLASEHALSIAQSELGNAIVNGTPLVEFASQLATRFESAGFTALNPSHVETVFRTNLIDTYNVGRKAEMSTPDALKLRPYWIIRTVKDDRQRETHGRVDGWILRATDPFWSSVKGPPWGFNCRCRLSTVREAKLAGRAVRSGAEIRGLPDTGFEPGSLWSEPI